MGNLRLDIIGEAGGISIPTFNESIAHALKILHELDVVLSNKHGGALQWYVGGLKDAGTLSITFTPHIRSFTPKALRKIPTNIAPQVTGSFITGFQNIQNEGTSPPYLSTDGLNRIASLVNLIHKNGAKGFQISDDTRSVDVSQVAAKNIHKLIREKRHAMGSVEGDLRTISLHRGMRVTVYHSISKKAVVCAFKDRDFLDVIRHALGKRVIASGIVHYNEKNEPSRVEMERIRVLRDTRSLPSIQDLSGSQPEFTGQMTTEDYIRSLRG